MKRKDPRGPQGPCLQPLLLSQVPRGVAPKSRSARLLCCPTELSVAYRMVSTLCHNATQSDLFPTILSLPTCTSPPPHTHLSHFEPLAYFPNLLGFLPPWSLPCAASLPLHMANSYSSSKTSALPHGSSERSRHLLKVTQLINDNWDLHSALPNVTEHNDLGRVVLQKSVSPPHPRTQEPLPHSVAPSICL